MSRHGEPRPDDEHYYRWRTEYLRQGDLFAEVPLGLQFPARAYVHKEGQRKFISGPFEVGFGMMITPTCSMAAQGEEGKYAHSFRTVVPVWPLAAVVDRGAIKPAALADLRRYDHLVNYFYLPALEEAAMPESVALLYAPTTLHHEFLEDCRIAQLDVTAAVHLKRGLASFYSGSRFSHEAFED